MGSQLPPPPDKNIVPAVPPTRIQVFLKRIKPWHWFHFPSVKERSAFPKDQIPFYKTNEFWGSAGLAVTLVLAGIAFGMNAHLTLAKWLLVAAWPFATMACWCALGRLSRRPRFLSSILLCLLLAIGLHKSYIVMCTGVHPVVAPEPETHANKPPPQQPPVSKEPTIAPPIPKSEPSKPKFTKPPHKVHSTQLQGPSTPEASPNPISPRIGTGLDAYKDISDEQLGHWAIEEADKIEQMAKECISRVHSAHELGGQVWLFSNEFKACCAQDVKDLRAEILRRLGPPAKDPREEYAWTSVLREMPLPPNAPTPSQFSGTDPMAVREYAPYLRRLGLKLKGGPVALHFSEVQTATGMPEFPYEIVVTIETTRELANGYILVKLNGAYSEARCDLEGFQNISNDQLSENHELLDLMAKRQGIAFEIGKTAFTPGKPIHVTASAKEPFHVSSVMFFDQ